MEISLQLANDVLVEVPLALISCNNFLKYSIRELIVVSYCSLSVGLMEWELTKPCQLSFKHNRIIIIFFVEH